MGVRQSVFGRMKDGVQVDRFELEGEGGLRLAVLTYGATIQSLIYKKKDVVLGYDRLEDYRTGNTSYQGATVGRYANRIAGRGPQRRRHGPSSRRLQGL